MWIDHVADAGDGFHSTDEVARHVVGELELDGLRMKIAPRGLRIYPVVSANIMR